MKRIINLLCFLGIGAAMASGGILWYEWQSFAILGLAATSSIVSEFM